MLTGAASYLFLRLLSWATNTRLHHTAVVWWMPLVGAVVAGLYHHIGGRAKGGTPAVLEQAHTYTHGVPLRMTPLILGGSIAGHVTGGAVKATRRPYRSSRKCSFDTVSGFVS